ncbi:MAG: hypothetical protein CO094_02760 [Anaerolineae bacterium CG_4_9_14_3_um_filter_57_17]|nr:hypothetical protein [bacterium]NCT21022.1 hypothetical protein [bacterium]OIO83307.1 MAG: hypothetical protein AUK01_12765 [Anaerolineae bacterium CG2_30_57_67]PJB67845.1 MAG: hypothetical protein CO094_02760 [Anaerolineae bacterium CG_4_9_14_3_um_filter_57_17]
MTVSSSSRRFIPWFALAFALALLLRLLRLGELPLSDAEANWALQALGLLRSQPVTLGTQPLYVHLTASLFFIFQASNAAARLVSALAGSGLVLAPLLFADKLGQKAALFLTFFLALDPGLLALSREAGSPILTMTLTALVWGLWRNNRVEWAGICVGWMLLSGPALWPGLLALAVSYGLTRGIVPADDFRLEASSLRRAAFYAIGAYLAFGSFFLLSPGGLGAIFRFSLDDFWTPGALPPLVMLTTPFIYQPLAIIFGLIAAVRGALKRDALTLFLTFWFFAALILSLAPPARPIGGLAWALIPLWTLAALELQHLLIPAQAGRNETLAMTVLTLLLLTFAALALTAVALGKMDPPSAQMYTLVALAAVLMLAVGAALVAQGWNTAVAWQGTLWGGLGFLAVYSLSIALFAANLKPHATVEFWRPGAQVTQADALQRQMNDLSLRHTGTSQSLKVILVGMNSSTTSNAPAALRWLLRAWDVTVAADFVPNSTSNLFITSEGFSAPQLESAYRGADFRWYSYPGWEQASAADWMTWLVEHSLPSGEENIILWARTDLFSNESNP